MKYKTTNISTSGSGGVSFFTVLGIVFVVLKLVGVINWPWVWVLSPIWGGCLLGIMGIILILVLAFVYGVFK